MNQGGYNLSHFNFLESQDIPDFSISHSYTIDNYNIAILLNQPVLSSQNLTNTFFDLKIDNDFVEIESVNIDELNNRVIIIESDEQFSFLSEITVTNYTNNQIISSFDEYLPEFYDYPVFNNLEDRHVIPWLIQVEDYDSQVGFVLEEC